MSIANGTYVIRSVYDTNLVIDSYGATDRSGANVQFWPWNNSDAQFVSVYGLGDGTYRMMFAATGKAIDIKDGAIAHATNVQQWEWNGSEAQRWVIEECGMQVPFGGKSYAAQKIRVAANHQYVLEGDNVHVAHAGTNIVISEDEGSSTDQMWIFVPANPVPTGTYQIVSALDENKCLAVSGGSKGDGAAVILFDRSDANYQKVLVRNMEDNGRTWIKFVHSMKLMESDLTNEAQADHIVCQCANSDGTDSGEPGTDQQWILEPSGNGMTIDGSFFQTYQISNFATEDHPLCVDVQDSDKSNNARVRLWPMNGANAQRFAFVPTEALANSADGGLPTPSNVGFMVGDEVVFEGIRDRDRTRLCFECPGDEFQGRYRMRCGQPTKTGVVFEEWGPWRSTYDTFCYVNEGWGDMWRPNIIVRNSPSFKATGELGIFKFNSNSCIAVQLQGEVRAFTSNYMGKPDLYAHGNSGGTGTVTLALRPEFSLDDAKITKDGVQLAYSSPNWQAGNCTVAVTEFDIGDERALTNTRRTSGLYGGAGYVTIGWGSLLKLPVAGTYCHAVAHMETGYLDSNPDGITKRLVLDSRFREISPTYVPSDHATYILTPDTDGTAKAFLMLGDSVMEIKRGSDGDFDIPVPLNRESHVTVVEVDADGTWGYKDVILPALRSHAFVWNFGDNDWAVLDFGMGSGPKQESKRERNHVDYVTTGRRFPATRFLTGGTRDVSVSGAVIGDLPRNGTHEAFVRLLDDGHAIFRNQRGEVIRVAVTGITDPYERGEFTMVNVEQQQESR